MNTFIYTDGLQTDPSVFICEPLDMCKVFILQFRSTSSCAGADLHVGSADTWIFLCNLSTMSAESKLECTKPQREVYTDTF